jgi:putative ABC transport system permease protein
VLSDLLYRLRALFRPNSMEADLDEELRAHLEHHVEKYVQSGLALEEARRRARLEFGGLDQVKEECRDARAVNLIETTLQDIRYGLRKLARSPGFTVVAVATLALGIGANTLIFSVVNVAVLHPLPFRNASRLVTKWDTSPTVGYAGPGTLTDKDYMEWRDQNRVFSDIATFRRQPTNLTGVGEPVRLNGATISASLLHVLDVNPALGRTFALEEEAAGHNRVVLLGDRLWRSRFGSNPAVLGKAIKLDGEFYTVIGVTPAGFDFPNQTEIWTPLTLKSEEHDATLQIVARLKPGVSLERARNDEAVLGKRLPAQPGDWEWHTTLVLLTQAAAAEIRTPLLVLFAAVGLVLLIACANVANLFLARATTRQGELSVRKALGASRSRLVRQMLTESVIMAVLGGSLGLLMAALGQGFVAKAASLLPRNLAEPGAAAHIASAGIDLWVLAFTLAVSVFTTILFGLAPTLWATRGEINSSLQGEGRRTTTGRAQGYMRDGIVITEVALAVILLVSAGLLIRSFLHLMDVDRGFDSQNVLTLNISLRDARYQSARSMIEFEEQALGRVRMVPGVKTAGGVFGLPLGHWLIGGDFTVEGQPPLAPGSQPFIATKAVVGGDYFRAIGIPLLRGRYFDAHDSEAAPHVVIVSQSLARHYWPLDEALGKRLEPGFSNDAWCTVVGVVGDTKQWSLGEPSSPAMYLPYAQAPRTFMMQNITLVLRAGSGPLALVSAARRAVQAVDPDLPVFDIATMDQLVYRSASAPRFNTALLGVFATLALVLAAVGIYGVMSYAVAQRTHEIGVRVALGAEASDILRQVVRQGMLPAVIGIATGIAGAWGMTRFLSSLLFGVRPTDPMTFAMVPVLLAAVGVLACLLPARRATKVDPVVALRYE